MIFKNKLPEAHELASKYPLPEKFKIMREDFIKEICAILSGKINKKIVIIGPCSADRKDAVIEYVSRLVNLQKKVSNKITLIPRIYTSKPRTTGIGYKGLLHRPNEPAGDDNILNGVIEMRKMHLNVIKETGMFGADEMLYPESIYYILDLLSYATVGARSAEDQGHRELASGLEIPVGMKNPISGDKNSLINSIIAAQHNQTLMYRGYEVDTFGNSMAHAIFRGANDIYGHLHPNYHYEDICEFHDLCRKNNIKNMALIIDCNHGNSGKRYYEQPRIAKEIISHCGENAELDKFIKGIMVESYLEDGNQLPGSGVYGKSITDACLGWDKSEKLVEEIYEMI